MKVTLLFIPNLAMITGCDNRFATPTIKNFHPQKMTQNDIWWHFESFLGGENFWGGDNSTSPPCKFLDFLRIRPYLFLCLHIMSHWFNLSTSSHVGHWLGFLLLWLNLQKTLIFLPPQPLNIVSIQKDFFSYYLFLLSHIFEI